MCHYAKTGEIGGSGAIGVQASGMSGFLRNRMFFAAGHESLPVGLFKENDSMIQGTETTDASGRFLPYARALFSM